MLVGCGKSQQSAPAPEVKPVEPVAEAAKVEPPTAEAPDISIHNAVIFGNIEAVKQHLAAGTDVDMKGNLGETPLFRAFERQNIRIAQLLVANGADVNAKDFIGQTPLHFAVSIDQKEFAELLIAKGADVNAKATNSRVVNGAPWAPLQLAAYLGHKEVAELLITKGADVNVKDGDGATPLDWADADTVDFFRKHGGKTSEEFDGTAIIDLLRKHDGKTRY